MFYAINYEHENIYIAYFYNFRVDGYMFFKIRNGEIVMWNKAIRDISIIDAVDPVLYGLLIRNADIVEVGIDFEFGSDFIFVAKENFEKYMLPHLKEKDYV